MTTHSGQATAVLAEKPSVARDIAQVLGAHRRGEGFQHGNGYIVTWAIGHLVSLAEPHEINPAWRRWRRDLLPLLPREWPLVVYEETRDQFEVVRRILRSNKVARIVAATDAGREGELIFRYIYKLVGCTKPVERLWISSLTSEAIRQGFRTLKPARAYDCLADAARARSRADWLVGMNLSRLYSLDCQQQLSVGRVQTPTLAMVVERELAIRSFVPEDYLQVVATFQPLEGAGDEPGEQSDGCAQKLSFKGTYFRPAENPASVGKAELLDKGPSQRGTRLPADGEEARQIVERAQTGETHIASIECETRRLAPPLLYDLTELQRHANRLYGFSAKRTLDLAQNLYEKHKLLTYPRTNSRHLSQDVAATVDKVVPAIAGPYQASLASGTGRRPLGRRFVDDAKVTDHHAIIPTGVAGSPPRGDEAKIYDLVCRRLLGAWHQDHVWAVTTIITTVTSPAEPEQSDRVVDRYCSPGTSVEQEGWKVLDLAPPSKAAKRKPTAEEIRDDSSSKNSPSDGEGAQRIPPGLAQGQPQRVSHVEALSKKTRPPKRFTEATLLTAMESAGKTLEEKELSDAMKDRGLGTAATRATIIETVLRREYLRRNGKSLEATEKGIHLIDVVHAAVKSPAMTGEWEAQLREIERGQGQFQKFMQGIEEYLRHVVGEKPVQGQPEPYAEHQSSLRPTAESLGSRPTRSLEQTKRRSLVASAGAGPQGALSHAPEEADRGPPTARVSTGTDGAEQGGSGLGELLRSGFGFESFRPYQEEVCEAAAAGRDVLLVMPTGAGKSLCYQLPGLARGGVTLVISPLIALMEDQVAKLQQTGLRAERIHSGRDRGLSREVCFRYLEGKLDFLFIAPERLNVTGFPEMLAKRTPTLIAIDEAHCISHWGHDFRPEYRMLGQRLAPLRPAPVIALTATATPLVQDDIIEQLGLNNPLCGIHGFRRDNIAIEVIERTPSQRPPAVKELLAEPVQRPAIIYAPTRKSAEELALELAPQFSTAAYHAGMMPQTRDQVQTAFLSGAHEVIVATIAFGMGIDKPNIRTVVHTGLPGSVEAYYQEIGRAGRDGKPSRAVLMYSWADRKTHEFFQARDYPAVEELERIFEKLSNEPEARQKLEQQVRMDMIVFEKALEKLWIHEGALIDPEENVRRGHDRWRAPYIAQREYKLKQLDRIVRFASSHECRMRDLVRHFGDQADSQQPCGTCDICAPDSCVVQRYRQPSEEENVSLDQIVEAVKAQEGLALGRLHEQVAKATPLERKTFEKLLGGLARAGLVKTIAAAFDKNGRRIEYRRVFLTEEGRQLTGSAAPLVSLPVEASPAPKKKKKKRTAKPGKKEPRPEKHRPTVQPIEADDGLPDPQLVEQLRAWRLEKARAQRIPAFRVFPDRTLNSIAQLRPTNQEELLQVPGIGPRLARKYGRKILSLVAGNDK